eukprot:7429013-Lingulodinium_polyedra.AAC.1
MATVPNRRGQQRFCSDLAARSTGDRAKPAQPDATLLRPLRSRRLPRARFQRVPRWAQAQMARVIARRASC